MVVQYDAAAAAAAAAVSAVTNDGAADASAGHDDLER